MWVISAGVQTDGIHPHAGTLSTFAMLNQSTEFTADISLGWLNNSLHPVDRLERDTDPPIQTLDS